MTTFQKPANFDSKFPPMDGVTFVIGDTITTTRDLTPTETATVQAWLDAFDPLVAIKAVARQAVKDRALLEMGNLDNDLDWGVVGTGLVMGEASRYLLAGRPVNPAPAQYAIAAMWRVRRNETLAQTLKWMADRYLVIYGDTANIIDIWNGKIEDINDAATIEDVQAIIDELQ
jgi:hypothetical protein